MAVRWRCAVILLTMMSSSVLSAIITGPSNKIYWRDRDTTGLVECIVSTPVSGGVFIVHDNTVIASADGALNPTKHSISETASETGNYSLIIQNLERADSGTYTCQHGGGEIGEITVADPPGDAQIVQLETTLTENTAASFQCKSTGGYPAPTFKWMKNGRELSETSYEKSDTGGLSQSQVTITLTHVDDQRDLECNVIHVLQNKTANLQLNVEYKPRISVQLPEGGNVVRKEVSFTLTCNIDSNPLHDTITWYRDTRIIQGATSDTYTEAGGLREDTEYKCVVGNRLGSSEASTNLLVQYAPIVNITQGDSLTKSEGERLVLSCEAEGVPDDISYRWVKGNAIQTTNRELVIASLSRSHNGVYTCVATNRPLGVETSANKSIAVTVNYAPGIPQASVSPAAQSGVWKAGTSVSLSCSLPIDGQGNPSATYHWMKDGAEVATGESFQLSTTSMNDTGSYSCKVSNPVGDKTSQPVGITIHDVPELLATSSDTLNITDSDGDYSLRCTFRGAPQPEVMWYFSNKAITSGALYTVQDTVTVDGFFTKVSSQLKFAGSDRKGITLEDMGSYRCEAASSIGEAEQSGSFSVNIIVPPRLTGFRKSAADVGESVEIVCDVFSNPPVSSISISRGGQDIISSPTVTVKDLETEVGDAFYHQRRIIRLEEVAESDYGTYDCNAVSSLDSITGTVSLLRTSKPDPPTELTHMEILWNSVSISWKPGFDGGKSQHFTALIDGRSYSMAETNTGLISDLYPGMTYTVTVMANNELGQSEISEELIVTTDPFVVPVPTIKVDQDKKSLTVNLNVDDSYDEEFCIIVQGSNEGRVFKDIYNGNCHAIEDSREFSLPASSMFSYYRAEACVVGRESQVCSISEKSEKVANDNFKWIIVGCVSGAAVIVIVIIIVAVVLVRKRRANKDGNSARKSISPSPNNGHINHVMIEAKDDIEIEPAYSTYAAQNNNLNGYSSNSLNSRNGQVSADPEAQNFDYVYAAVHKKSAIQSKAVPPPQIYNNYGHHPGGEHYEMTTSPAESNSDNTEEDTLDDLPNDLVTIIGNHPPTFHRHPSVSESGYSTPDSKALKRVIYEVIV